MPDLRLGVVDLVTVAVYLVLILWIGFRAAPKSETSEDYFLAGRSLSWPLVGFSLFASNVSSSTLLGLASDAYTSGIAVYNYEWFAVVVLVFFIVFFLPFYLRAGVYTLPEFLERRFDARSRYYFSALSILASILLEVAGALYAGALVIRLVAPTVPLWQAVLALALLSGLYTTAGGLRAVVYTDAVQAVLLVAGTIVVSVAAFAEIGSWQTVVAATPPEMLSLIQPADDPTLPWPGLVTGLPILGIYYWCTNQYIVQRTLAARDLNHGRWGALFAGLLKVPVLFIMVFPGVFARVLYPDISTPDLVFPTLLFDLLPAGLRGVVLVALLAAIMSSLDSTLNAVSTLVTMDFVKKLRPATTNRRLVAVGRLATLIVMVLGVVWTPYIERFPSLWQYLQTVLAYLSPPVVAVFLVGIFWRRANGDGAFAALLAGFGLGVVLIAIRPGIHFLYVAPLVFLACSVLVVFVSLCTRKPEKEKIEEYVWSPNDFRADSKRLAGLLWYQNYRILALLLLGCAIGVVAMFV